MEAKTTDMYGVTEPEARQVLMAFLRDTLQEPQAELEDLHLVDGRWQSDVDQAERGTRVVFLNVHNGQLAPGHMTPDAHADVTQEHG